MKKLRIISLLLALLLALTLPVRAEIDAASTKALPTRAEIDVSSLAALVTDAVTAEKQAHAGDTGAVDAVAILELDAPRPGARLDAEAVIEARSGAGGRFATARWLNCSTNAPRCAAGSEIRPVRIALTFRARLSANSS